MLNKLKRLPVYMKNVFLLALLWPPATVLRKTNKNYRNLWVVMERGFDARDNAYWFFRYLREKQPQINSCYVIDKSSPDFEFMSGRRIPRVTIRLYMVMEIISKSTIIISHHGHKFSYKRNGVMTMTKMMRKTEHARFRRYMPITRRRTERRHTSLLKVL